MATDLKVINSAGVWQTPPDIRYYNGSDWQTVRGVYVYNGATWILVWPTLPEPPGPPIGPFIPEWIFTAVVDGTTYFYYVNLNTNTWLSVPESGFNSSRTIQPLSMSTGSGYTTWGAVFGGVNGSSGTLVKRGNFPGTIIASGSAPDNYGTVSAYSEVADFNLVANSQGEYKLITVHTDGNMRITANVYNASGFTTNTTSSVLNIGAAGRCITAGSGMATSAGNTGRGFYNVVAGASGVVVVNHLLANAGIYNYDSNGDPIQTSTDAFGTTWYRLVDSAGNSFRDTAFYSGLFTHLLCGDNGYVGYLMAYRVDGLNSIWFVVHEQAYQYYSGGTMKQYDYDFTDNINKIMLFDSPFQNAQFSSIEGIILGDNGFAAVLGKPFLNPEGGSWTTADPNRVWTKITLVDTNNNAITGDIVSASYRQTLAAPNFLEIVIATSDGRIYKNVAGGIYQYQMVAQPIVTEWRAVSAYDAQDLI